MTESKGYSSFGFADEYPFGKYAASSKTGKGDEKKEAPKKINYVGKVYCSANHTSEAVWLPDFKIVDKLEDADLLLIGGGEDINPAIYHQKQGKYTGSPSHGRDKTEITDFNRAVELGKPIIGICRGAQLMCALAGGKLIQHVDNHSGSHWAKNIDNQDMVVTSAHHQMMYPYNLDQKDYKILAWAKNLQSQTWLDGQNKEMWLPNNFQEIEAIVFPKLKAFGVQYHPEWMTARDQHGPALKWTRDILDQLMADKFTPKLQAQTTEA